MPDSLQSARVATVLNRLFTQAEKDDPSILERVQAEARRLGGPLDDTKLAPMLSRAFIPVSRDVGRLLYMLVRTGRCRHVVEFGTSFGISTVHLAAALRDNGGGRLITTELEPEKLRQARENLREAGLEDLVELRQGDARETLRELKDELDFVFLDGWKALYLPVLKALEPRLRPGSLVVADDLDIAPQMLAPYLEYTHRAGGPYVAIEVPMGDKLDIALWVG